MENRRILTTGLREEDRELEPKLRPATLDTYIGQESVKENMRVFIEAAKQRKEALDHVLLYGPPGLGKTTLSNIIANEMGVNIKTTSGPAIERPGDMAAVLNSLNEGDILFIDEIQTLHRLPPGKAYSYEVYAQSAQALPHTGPTNSLVQSPSMTDG